MRLLFASVVLLASLVPALAEALEQRPLRLIPARPTAGEAFVIMVPGSANFFDLPRPAFASTSIRSEGANVTLVTPDRIAWLISGSVTMPAAGTYTAVFHDTGTRYPSVSYDLGSFEVDPPRAAAQPQWTTLSGNCFSADEDGHGLNVLQGATGQIFATWLTYSPGYEGIRSSYWLVASGGKWIDPATFRALLYQTRGTLPDHPYDPAHFTANPIGVLTLRFVSPTEVDFEAELVDYLFRAIRKQKRMHKQQF